MRCANEIPWNSISITIWCRSEKNCAKNNRKCLPLAGIEFILRRHGENYKRIKPESDGKMREIEISRQLSGAERTNGIREEKNYYKCKRTYNVVAVDFQRCFIEMTVTHLFYETARLAPNSPEHLLFSKNKHKKLHAHSHWLSSVCHCYRFAFIDFLVFSKYTARSEANIFLWIKPTHCNCTSPALCRMCVQLANSNRLCFCARLTAAICTSSIPVFTTHLLQIEIQINFANHLAIPSRESMFHGIT